jgi:hypothetical protein
MDLALPRYGGARSLNETSRQERDPRMHMVAQNGQLVVAKARPSETISHHVDIRADEPVKRLFSTVITPVRASEDTSTDTGSLSVMQDAVHVTMPSLGGLRRAILQHYAEWCSGTRGSPHLPALPTDRCGVHDV